MAILMSSSIHCIHTLVVFKYQVHLEKLRLIKYQKKKLVNASLLPTSLSALIEYLNKY